MFAPDSYWSSPLSFLGVVLCVQKHVHQFVAQGSRSFVLHVRFELEDKSVASKIKEVVNSFRMGEERGLLDQGFRKGRGLSQSASVSNIASLYGQRVGV